MEVSHNLHMETDTHITQIQAAISYTFQNPDNLNEALRAAGADNRIYDGNRRLAQLGESIIKTVILDSAFTIGAARGRLVPPDRSHIY